jgi:hypothetical protein
MTLSPSLPADVWQVLYAAMMGQPVPFHVQRQAIQQFETAMQAAQQPAPAKDPE